MSTESTAATKLAVDDARVVTPAHFTTFALHEVLDSDDGATRCGCPDGAACARIGKHPASLWGPDSLATGEQSAGRTGYGIATGERSGIFVLDLDVKDGKNGVELLATLVPSGEALPPTLTIETPTGGRHLYFLTPLEADGSPVRVKTSSGEVGPGIDVRGEGGFVVGPDSRHKNGGTYHQAEAAGDEIAKAPPWLVALLGRAGAASDAIGRPALPALVTPATGAALVRGRERAIAYAHKVGPCVAHDGADAWMNKVTVYLACTSKLPAEDAWAIFDKHYNPRCFQADGITPYPWSREEFDRQFANAARGKVAQREAATQGLAKSMRATCKNEAPANDAAAPRRATPGTAEDDYDPDSDAGVEARTDTGNARRFVRLHGKSLRYVYSWGRWLTWDGKRWADGDQGAPLALTEDVHQDIALSLGEDGAKWAKNTQARSRRENMVALAKVDPRLAISHESLDQRPMLFNVENGTIDLQTGALRAHDPADLLRQVSHVKYDRAATCPTWQAFLATIFAGRPELVSYMQRAIGYSLTGDVGEQCLFFLVGTGANGKSTLTSLVLKLLGDAGKLLDRSVIMAKRDDGHPAGVAALVGARMAVCSELPKGKAWDEAMVKALSGGDRVVARGMRENFWEFTPTAKLWIHANDRPIVRGSDHGIWRRFRLIPMDVTIVEEKRDAKLPEKLEAELPGILNWAIEGCREWQRAGLQTPTIVRQATDAYRKDMDIVGEFLDEECAIEPAAFIARARLYRAFRHWWENQSSTPPINAKDFAGRLRERAQLQEKVVQGERQWVGVKIRDPYSPV